MDPTEAEGWLCEICQNETSLEASLVCIEYDPLSTLRQRCVDFGLYLVST